MKHVSAFRHLLFSILLFTTCSEGIVITNLRVNNLDVPLGIDQTPQFSWIVTTQKRCNCQKAYEIEVVDEQGTEMWNSGKVLSANSYQIAYSGKEIKPKSLYRWRVRIWDIDDKPSAWSAWHTFEMAMLTASDWKAQWIMANNTERKEDATHVSIVFDNPVSARFIRMDAQKLGLPVINETNRYSSTPNATSLRAP